MKKNYYELKEFWRSGFDGGLFSFEPNITYHTAINNALEFLIMGYIISDTICTNDLDYLMHIMQNNGYYNAKAAKELIKKVYWDNYDILNKNAYNEREHLENVIAMRLACIRLDYRY